MIIYKNFSISEGHYTGPKDQDKVPGALEVIGKSAIGGALAGAGVGAVLKDSTALEGAIQGSKYGALAGALFKFFLNYLHNPMSHVKYQDVDRNIRREFGIIRAAGVTVGDTVKKRANLDEKFSFNDRRVTDYKLNFSIQDDQLTMYTYGIDDKEMDKIDKILDYYCKKYFGMEYSSTMINQKMNSYAVHITFTNNQVISNFMMELSDALETKINLLDNKALVQGRLSEGQKEFSVKPINKYDMIRILTKSGNIPMAATKSFKEALSYVVMSLVSNAGNQLAKGMLVESNLPMPRESFGNTYLESVLKKLHYVEGFHYTIGQQDSKLNMSMISGRLVITAEKGEQSDEVDKVFSGNRTDTGKVIIYTYMIQSKKEFESVLKRFMSCGLVPNIFEG